MNNSSLYIVIILVIVIITYVLSKLQSDKVTYVESMVDNQPYLVRNLDDKQQAADMLARLKIRMMKLVEHLNMHKNDKYIKYKPYIEQLSNRIQNVVINENGEDNNYTSYSVNKGEQIVFCLRSKNGNRLHNLNLLMYVTLHEIAHVACPEVGHTELFKDIFAFFTQVAINLNLYDKINFDNIPTEYCGMMITDSII